MARITRIEPKVPAPVQRKKVAAYARVSKDTDGLRHSLSAQVSYYSSLIQKNPEWEYAGVFADLGITGTSMANRTEFLNLMKECEARNVDIILCKSISRFARNTVDTLETVRHLREIGVEVHFEREKINTGGADGELLLTLLASFAEGESRSLSDNIKWVVNKKYESGKPHTRQKMMGYRWEGDDLVIVPEQAEIVRRIYREYLDGGSFNAISKRLEADGIIGLRGKPLPVPSVKGILTNEEYTGVLIFHRHFNYAPKKEKVNRGEVDMYRVEDHHEPIIDKATFDKVQGVMAERNVKYHPRNDSTAVFKGKVFCGECGYRCTPHAYHNRDKAHKMRHRFICNKKHQYGIAACGMHGFAMSRMEKACEEVLGTKEFREKFDKEVRKVTIYGDFLDFEMKNGRNVKWQKQR